MQKDSNRKGKKSRKRGGGGGKTRMLEIYKECGYGKKNDWK